jgi:hypothetical protein
VTESIVVVRIVASLSVGVKSMINSPLSRWPTAGLAAGARVLAWLDGRDEVSPGGGIEEFMRSMSGSVVIIKLKTASTSESIRDPDAFGVNILKGAAFMVMKSATEGLPLTLAGEAKIELAIAISSGGTMSRVGDELRMNSVFTGATELGLNAVADGVAKLDSGNGMSPGGSDGTISDFIFRSRFAFHRRGLSFASSSVGGSISRAVAAKRNPSGTTRC